MTRKGMRTQRRGARPRRPRTTGAGAGTRSRGRRPVVAAGLIAICVMIVGIALAFRHLHPSVPPNVLLITIDTLRADHVGCYRALPAPSGTRPRSSVVHIETPVLDRLAARGTLFVNAVSQAPLTLPSHASMLTGLTPPAHRIRDNAGFALGADVPTVAEQFRSAGYTTAAFVSGYPLDHRFGLNRGFEVYDDRLPRGDPARPFVERRADATVRAAVAWLERSARTSARPLFAWVHLFDPHAPYDPPEPFRARFRDQPYDGEIAFADSQIGVLLAGLARIGTLANTLVLAVSDHGEGLGDHDEATHGLLIYDSTIRIPMILAGPGVRSGVRATTLVRAMDVGPTLLDLAGLSPLQGAEGRSLEAGARGRELPPEDAYVESLFGRLNFGWAPLYGWRSQRAMFIEAPREEMYDLEADPAQAHDLSTTRAADVATYRQRLRAVSSRDAAAAHRAPLPAEARERLNSLGYVSGTAGAGAGSLRNPRDFVALAFRVEKATTIERSDPQAAVDEFRAALSEDPTNTLAREHLAIALTHMRRFDEALSEARQLIAAGNTSADLLALVGECYRVTGRYDQALDAFGRAAQRDPQATDPLIGAGRTLVALGRRDEARQALERALSLAPDESDALSALADLSIERGDLAEARLRLETLRASGGGDAAADLKLGVVLVRQGELDRAIALFRDVSDNQPGNIEAAVDLGAALAKAGRSAESVPYFERAIAAGVKSPVVWNSLAVARLETGNHAGAVEALRQSLRIKRDQPDIAAMLEKLRGR